MNEKNGLLVAAVAIVFGALVLITSTSTVLTAPACSPPAPSTSILVTADCIDPRFNQPYVDVDEQRTTPVPHRYVHGGFTGTDAKFSFYFPPAEQYQRRFFQITHQLLTSENTTPGNISFAVASGAYFVQTNIGGVERATTTEQAVFGKLDPSVGGYRVNAEAAKYSRIMAAKIYGEHRPYGYLYGGSGGAFQTISSAENSVGVWDGFVPYVMGSPNAIPGVFTVRIHALRVLRMRNKFPAIMDAVDPGGSGNPYEGLNEEERAALEEATRLGFPLRGWWNHATLTGGPLALVAGYVPYLDPTYIDDFWSKPGYLGADPKSSVAGARIRQDATVVDVIAGPQRRLRLSSVPPGDLTGADLVVTSGANAGKSVPLGPVMGDTVASGFGANPAVANAIQSGDRVRIDNSWYLALQTYHRHQLPTPDMYGWNQFRGPKGAPLYPQRSVLIGPIGAMNGAGSLQSGRINGKMIAVEALMDIDALPWQADWYRTKVKEALGSRIDDSFRLWFIDHAQHTPPVGVPAQARTISYQGVLEQALRDVSAWVERGVRPPSNTRYNMVESQVQVPPQAAQRGGIQPVVTLKANGRERADVGVGEPVTFVAEITVPPDTGKVVAAEWDLLGAGDYPVAGQLAAPGSSTSVKTTYSYSQPGTYFPVLRATSQREGDSKTPYARIQNLGRVRVVVKAAAAASAQSASSSFSRGNSLQSWQNPGLAAVLAKCKKPPQPFSIPGGQSANASAPPAPALPRPTEIPGVIAAGQSWKVVWSWEGNNADGPIAGDNGTLLFANNDASNVMKLDPATGLATVVHSDTNTGGALSRSKNGALFLASRGLNGGILRLEPTRKMFASSFRGEPFECIGGVLNDLEADSRGGVYLTITGGGLFYANPQGVVSQYGDGMSFANGIVLSPDEKTPYVTNGAVVMAFDVQADGSLIRQREFGKLRGGQAGDGSAVDAQGRLYVATGASADVFASNGEFLGSIPGPQGMHGVAFGGRDKKTLFGIVFYGGWGTPSARNQIVAIPMIAQGYTGRAK